MRLARVAPRVAARALEAWGRRPPPPTGDPSTDDAYARGRVESFRRGGLWLARELAYLGRPWGFELADVARAGDALVGRERHASACPRSARDYERALPNATLRLEPGTHQILFSRWRDILEERPSRPGPVEQTSHF